MTLPAPTVLPTSTAPGRILVVDDEEQLMITLCEMLRQEGYEAAGFTSGELALAALQSDDFDVALADLMMPGLDGLAMLRAALEFDPMLVFIIMTGQGTVSSAVEAMKGGAFDYLLKPFKFGALLPVLERALQVRRLRLENVQLRETLALYELNQVIALALDEAGILERAADAALELCAADESSLMLTSPDGGELCVAVVRGAPRPRALGACQPLAGSGIAAWAARQREPLVLFGPVTGAAYAPVQPRPEIQAAISMPMVAGNDLVGVLNVNTTRRRRRFTPGQVMALSILAGTAASALANARLLDRVREAEASYRSIFENVQEGVFQATAAGQFVTVNPALGRMLGYASPAEFLAAVPDLASLCLLPEAHGALLRRLQTTREVTGYEHQASPAAGPPRWLSLSARLVPEPRGRAHCIEGTIHDVTERKQRERQIAAVAQLSSALRGAAGRAEMLPVILDEIMAVLEVEAADIDLPDPDSGEYVVALGGGQWAGATGLRIAIEKSISARVLDRGAPETNLLIHSDQRVVWRERLGSVPYATCIPLGAHGQPLGALWLGHTRALSDDEVRLLVALTDIAANALRRATLFEQTEQRAEQMAAVNRLGRALAESLDLAEVHHGLIEAAAALLPGANAVRLWLLDPGRQALRCVYGVAGGRPIDPAAQGLLDLQAGASAGPAEAALREIPVILRPEETGAYAALCVPMVARARLVGVIQVEGGPHRRFTAADADLLTLVASTAAVAVENAALFSETERRLRRLTGLRAIDQAITSSFDLRVTLNVLLDQVTAQLGAGAAAVLLLNPHLRVLEFAAGRGFRALTPVRTRLALGEGYAGRAALERRPISIPDLRNPASNPQLAAQFADQGFESYYCIPLSAKGAVKGVLELLHREGLRPDQEWLEYLETLAGQAAIAIDNVVLFDELQRSNAELVLAYDATIEGWSRALDLRDRETEGHTERVTEMTLRLARAAGLGDDEMVHARRGALLHDIGKMGIPDSILHKPGPLTPAEWDIMRQHPVYAYEMLAPIGYLRRAIDIPYCHHEKWDGAGYPRGLRGEQIPLAARVFAVADVWDALRSDRPYRQAWPEDKVRDYITQQAGAHFDPKVVEVFLSLR